VSPVIAVHALSEPKRRALAQHMVELAASGVRQRAIGRMLGCSQSTVSACIRWQRDHPEMSYMSFHNNVRKTGQRRLHSARAVAPTSKTPGQVKGVPDMGLNKGVPDVATPFTTPSRTLPRGRERAPGNPFPSSQCQSLPVG
jgi:hypothetical protein